MKNYLIAAAAGALLFAAGIVAMTRRKDWNGISEEAARAKLDAALPNRVSDERRSKITEKVVMKMKERGVIAGATKVEMEPTVVTTEEAEEPDEAPVANPAGAGMTTSTSGH